MLYVSIYIYNIRVGLSTRLLIFIDENLYCTYPYMEFFFKYVNVKTKCKCSNNSLLKFNYEFVFLLKKSFKIEVYEKNPRRVKMFNFCFALPR